MPHAFSLGDRVLFNPKVISGDVGFFSLITSMDSQEQGVIREVVRTLPPAGTPYQYHIRSNQDGGERLVDETQIRPAL